MLKDKRWQSVLCIKLRLWAKHIEVIGKDNVKGVSVGNEWLRNNGRQHQ